MGSKVVTFLRRSPRAFGRAALLATSVTILASAPACQAAPAEEVLMDASALMQLEARAATAQPKEQCFLYAELVHQLTETAGKQLAEGRSEEAGATLKRIDSVSQKIHVALARDTKRLKNAELILHHTSRRLLDMVHVASADDQQVLQSTLKRLDVVQAELLAQVFEH